MSSSLDMWVIISLRGGLSLGFAERGMLSFLVSRHIGKWARCFWEALCFFGFFSFLFCFLFAVYLSVFVCFLCLVCLSSVLPPAQNTAVLSIGKCNHHLSYFISGVSWVSQVRVSEVKLIGDAHVIADYLQICYEIKNDRASRP